MDRSGHQRQVRHAQERVLLSVMAVWQDGSHEILHYQIAEQEETTAWPAALEELLARGLCPKAVKVVVSDGSRGLLTAMAAMLPNVQQQRCITHKVRGMEPYLSYEQLPTTDEQEFPGTLLSRISSQSR